MASYILVVLVTIQPVPAEPPVLQAPSFCVIEEPSTVTPAFRPSSHPAAARPSLPPKFPLLKPTLVLMKVEGPEPPLPPAMLTTEESDHWKPEANPRCTRWPRGKSTAASKPAALGALPLIKVTPPKPRSRKMGANALGATVWLAGAALPGDAVCLTCTSMACGVMATSRVSPSLRVK